MHLGHWPTKWGLLNVKSMRETYISYRDRLSLRVSGSHQKVAELSGGNQQKVLLGRLLSLKPKILILDEPTLGIDVGTKEEVHRLINELTEQGMGALILAYDTDEMIRLVDRALAFQDGRVVRELSGADLTIEGALSALEHVPSASVESEHQWIGKSI
jgi:ABC-type sugar transport system ATPase subunit